MPLGLRHEKLMLVFWTHTLFICCFLTNHLISNELTSRNKVLLEKLTVDQLVNKFLSHYKTQRFFALSSAR